MAPGQEIETFLHECAVCQRVKGEHCHYPGLLDPLPLPTSAWTDISLDFFEGLPKSLGKEVILLVVDRFTKYSHFIPLAHPYTVQSVSHAFMDNVFKWNGLPKSIVSDRNWIFTSNMWQAFFKALQVKLRFSSAYHPQSDGQTERVNQCVENYLRCMVFQQPRKWASLDQANATWEDADFIKGLFPEFYTAPIRGWCPNSNT